MNILKELPFKKHPDLSINWERAIHIDDVINESLIRRVLPEILKLRQESNDPITVAINSPGGSLTSLDTVMGLLQGPTQFYNTGTIITVVTNKAYSAAANLLSQGDYAVAFRHSNILFHDVRFGQMEDVTPSKALVAAKSLQDENDRFALKLANNVIRRLVWVYLDLAKQFQKNNSNYSFIYNANKRLIPDLPAPQHGASVVDISSFATTLYSKLSIANQPLINGVMKRLGKWIYLNKLSDSYPTYRAKGSRKPGLLDGAQRLYKELDVNAELPKNFESEIKLMITLMTSELGGYSNSFSNIIEEATRNFNLMQSMNDDKHRHSAIRLMLRHDSMFFNVELDELEELEKKAVVQEALPHAQLFWLFCVSLCRELFEGDHVLSPEDCQLLGLVDEVAGGGPVESRREFRVANERSAKKQ